MIGLVTVLFNSDEVLEGFFKSVSQQAFKNYHLFLIDNTPSAATDALIAKCSVKYPVTAYTHIKNADNAGVAKGNNQGIELSIAAGATHTLLLNNDIEFYQDNLFGDIYQTAVDKNEPLVIPKILFFDSHKIWMAGGRMNHFKGTSLHVGEGDDDGPQYNNFKHFEYAPTCFMLIDNKVFKQIGMMDEKYFVYYDDTDFIYRITKAGYKIFYMPHLVVLHKVSSLTGGEESLFSIYYSNRNRLYFIRKNYAGLRFLVAFLVTLSTRLVKFIKYSPQQKEQLRKAITAGLKL